jgi:hypothetical protein
VNIYNVRRLSKFKDFVNEKLQLSSSEVSILDKCTKGVWEESDGVINIDGDFIADGKINSKTLSPLVFGKVTGSFDISNNSLESLIGCPSEVGSEFNCSGNLLSSLEGGPKKAPDYFCANNYLISLDGISEDAQNISAPGNSLENILALNGRSIKENLFLNNNFLKSLEGCPKEIGGSLDISECNLSSLKGCSIKVDKNFDCSANQLDSLEGGPSFVGGYYDCGNNSITSLEGIASNKMKWIDASNNQIYSVIDLPTGLVNAKVGLHKNALPLEILRSQQEFVEDKGDINLRNWLEFTLKNEMNQRYSPLTRMIEMFNDNRRKDAVIKFIEKTDLAGISQDNPKLLAPIASGVNKNSPMAEYINKNKDLFSDEFLDSLEISSDLKDLGF